MMEVIPAVIMLLAFPAFIVFLQADYWNKRP